MRVLHVLGELRASGGEVMLRDALGVFRDHGIETIVLSTGDQIGDFATQYHRLGVQTLHLPFERNGGFAANFWRLIRTVGVDVVHVHTERANAVMGFAARLAGKRVIRTVHSVFSYSGRLRRIRTVERAALRAIGVRHISIGPSVERNEHERLRNATMRVDNWIGPHFRPPSEVERDAARRLINLDPTVVAITTIGNCSSVKNHVALLEALPGIARELKRPIVYLHVGSGHAEHEERVLANSSLPHGVAARFLGTISDVRSLLWASDVYCMPSLYEGVGIAALEALACGVPSVLADVDGLRDIHPQTAAVRYVRPDAAGVTAGISKVLTDTIGARTAALHAAQSVRLSRNVKQRAAELVRIYKSR